MVEGKKKRMCNYRYRTGGCERAFLFLPTPVHVVRYALTCWGDAAGKLNIDVIPAKGCGRSPPEQTTRTHGHQPRCAKFW